MPKASGTTNLLKGTRGNDTLAVSERLEQAWTVDGGAGNDTLRGGNGADTLLGGGGDDVIFGMPDDVRLDGGLGYDTLDLSLATATVRYLGTSFSTAQLTYWPDYSPSTYTVANGFERVIGSSFTDALFGGPGAETLEGAGGADHLDGGGGNDTLSGGEGADYFEFSHNGSGTDRVLDFQLGQDHLFFYGVSQPNLTGIYSQGADLIIPWSDGTVILSGLGGLDPSAYPALFTLTNGDLTVLP